MICLCVCFLSISFPCESIFFYKITIFFHYQLCGCDFPIFLFSVVLFVKFCDYYIFTICILCFFLSLCVFFLILFIQKKKKKCNKLLLLLTKFLKNNLKNYKIFIIIKKLIINYKMVLQVHFFI